ncbi:MAG TPA: ABC transporter ATP-binding protein [Candidatus Agrococcus pullicola]|uniref:ABC transporter ATP-binding protein n=1 Tax=Candidatus Agrococcus pullicola TaxID=2838429 RepID=A0A9D1YVU7_9MICO|nr:ABC transporter ATP-binding protein [Candidatus Agrococcus pullicola]
MTNASLSSPPVAIDEPAIEINGLNRRFGRGEHVVRAVDGIDLRIRRGEIVALLGPNGAGKTTALDMLLGLSDPNEGTVNVLGMHPRRAVAAGRIAAVLQTGGLLPDLTVRETVSVIAGLHGALHRVGSVMDQAGLEPIAGRRIGKCSGGEQQRVKFALALIPDPDILVLDEPTAGMDVTARRRFWDVMRQDADSGRTILFATHYLEEAEQFARRTIVLDHGKVVADEPTTQLRSSLGGRTVSATLPRGGEADELVTNLRTASDAEEITLDDGRLTVRTSASDELAGRLLALGATELEIAAPSLESAFMGLTKE